MNKVRIAFDAMGGDFAPYEIVKGAIIAAQEFKIKAFLVGKPAEIEEVLIKIDKEGIKSSGVDYEIVEAMEDIDMAEKNPAKAVRAKRNSSVVVSNKLVSEGRADAVIAAGNTGAATAASLLVLRRIKGFERPCIASPIPTKDGVMLLVDAGSNVETTPSQMLQNALIGNILSKVLYKIENPRIGLLNVGEEPGKGNEVYKESHELLEACKKINFMGNVEGKVIPQSICDVAVCDGFTGNIHLKAIEGGLKLMVESFRSKLKTNPIGMLAALLLKLSGVFDSLKKHFSPSSYGGALLGGVQGVSIISHGSSDAEAIKNAARNAKLFVEAGVVDKVKQGLEDLAPEA